MATANPSGEHITECLHLSSDEVGHEPSGAVIYRCPACGDVWSEDPG